MSINTMSISTRSYSRTTHYITESAADGTYHEFAVQCEPCPWLNDGVLIHRTETDAVVAYLVQDDNPSNPMKEFDGQGVIYTNDGNRSITDDRGALLDALELDSYGEVDWDKMLTLDGKRATLAEHAADKVFAELTAYDVACHLLRLTRDGDIDLDYSIFKELDDRTMSDERVFELRDLHKQAIRDDLLDPNGYHGDLMSAAVTALYAKHWQEVVGPWVLPIYYHSERGSTRIHLTTWDGDNDELPDGVWIADRNVIGNLPDPSAPDFKERITAYADAVLKEYEDWCNGNVYGCVVHTYKREEDDWVEVGDHDSCWGFIGDEYAQQALRDEFFEPAVKRLQNNVTA